MGSNKGASETQPLVPKLAADEEDPLLNTPDTHTPSIASDAWDIIQLGIPIFISRLSFVGMKTTDTALLGHVSREALSASALSDLWTMCSQVLLNGRILGVLVGGAIGANNPKLAGIYLQGESVLSLDRNGIVFEPLSSDVLTYNR
jgi:hypothetical protein